MKIKATTKCSIPRLGLNFEAGETKDLVREQAETLLMTGNFVSAEEGAKTSDTGENEGSYKHREMRTRRRNLSA